MVNRFAVYEANERRRKLVKNKLYIFIAEHHLTGRWIVYKGGKPHSNYETQDEALDYLIGRGIKPVIQTI